MAEEDDLTRDEAQALLVVLERVEIRKADDNLLILYPALETAEAKLRHLAHIPNDVEGKG